MKQNKESASRLTIRQKIFVGFLVFILLTLAIFWLCQVILFDAIYRSVRVNELRATAHYVLEHTDSLSFYADLTRAANRNDLSAAVFSSDGSLVYPSVISRDSVLFPMTKAHQEQLIGSLLQNQTDQALIDAVYSEAQEEYTSLSIVPSPYSLSEDGSALLISRFEREGQTYFLMLDGPSSPANTVQKTIASFLLLVNIALVVFALLLTAYLSRSIARPIVAINQQAKKLVHGSYEGVEGGTKEVEELNQTLTAVSGDLARVETIRRELIANLSHDLRTPLTLIKGYTEMMRDLPGEVTPENLQEVIDETERLTTLVNDMFDISRLENGAMEVRRCRYCLTASVRSTVERYAAFTAPKGFRILLEDDSEDVYVNADETMISQVVGNLINNAMTYTGDDKKVTLRQSVDHATGWVRIEVTDTGCGIEADKLPLIWERYYKIDGAHKRAAVGTGLGLSIVRGIMENHGGRYGVRSSPDNGSTFWFELPMA